MKKVERFILNLETSAGPVELEVEPCRGSCEMFVAEASDLAQFHEAKHQLKEHSRYRYYFKGNKFQFRKDKATRIIQPSMSKTRLGEGEIDTGVFVGTLTLDVVQIDNPEETVGYVSFEIQSSKIGYRNDYKIMMQEIAEAYVELVMGQGSPVTQTFEVDLENTDPRTDYQRFAFVKSIIESDEFALAISKIQHNPVKRWTDTRVQRNINSVRRLLQDGMRQIASNSRRVPIDPRRYGLPNTLTSLPESIEVPYKMDTADVFENQFVKYVLWRFRLFCSEIGEKKEASERLRIEAAQTENLIDRMLSSVFFRSLSMPKMITFNSPVLQRKEGYREVLQAWIFFDLAAKIAWKGGENIYKAGKRNVAALYEYWLFFKLKNVIEDFFDLDSKSIVTLVDASEEGISLNLKQGVTTVVDGVYKNPTRHLNMRFFYNKTFSVNNEIFKEGSWSIPMRPDYTLAIWPEDMRIQQAEEEDLVVYIHFDAKYRLKEIFRGYNLESEEDIENAKDDEQINIYRQGDILKMHAYKDAIRRTVGSYVLYPGDVDKQIRGYREVIPGLGAFDIRPGDDVGIEKLKEFFKKVVDHLLNRSSMRERRATHDHLVVREEKHDYRNLKARIPEASGPNRSFIPDETVVLLGFYKSDEHLEWIEKNKMYNFRAGKRRGSFPITPELASAKYLILHNGKESYAMYKIDKEGPRIFSREDLHRMKYPDDSVGTSKDYIYLTYSLQPSEKEYDNYYWDLSDFKDIIKGSKSRMQFCYLTDVMLRARKKDNLSAL